MKGWQPWEWKRWKKGATRYVRKAFPSNENGDKLDKGEGDYWGSQLTRLACVLKKITNDQFTVPNPKNLCEQGSLRTDPFGWSKYINVQQRYSFLNKKLCTTFKDKVQSRVDAEPIKFKELVNGHQKRWDKWSTRGSLFAFVYEYFHF